MTEIERKFLVTSDAFIALAESSSYIVQGYLTKDPERSVRIRIKANQSYITVKGISDESGKERFEWEKEIDLHEGKQLLNLALPTVIEKTRYFVPHAKHTFEVDVFEGKHKGLIICEVELNSSDEKVDLPAWVGQEVTGQKEYYNSYLSSVSGDESP